jgi:hypothetical protein
MMTIPLSANEVLDREFLAARAKLIELAAILDRIDRADGDPGDDDPRLAQFRQSFELLAGEGGADRAERVQTLFSLPYDENWQQK